MASTLLTAPSLPVDYSSPRLLCSCWLQAFEGLCINEFRGLDFEPEAGEQGKATTGEQVGRQASLGAGAASEGGLPLHWLPEGGEGSHASMCPINVSYRRVL